ncbi:hypothetical protein GJAV_G00126180, partial [Gymnothorax javanicus]
CLFKGVPWDNSASASGAPRKRGGSSSRAPKTTGGITKGVCRGAPEVHPQGCAGRGGPAGRLGYRPPYRNPPHHPAQEQRPSPGALEQGSTSRDPQTEEDLISFSRSGPLPQKLLDFIVTPPLWHKDCPHGKVGAQQSSDEPDQDEDFSELGLDLPVLLEDPSAWDNNWMPLLYPQFDQHPEMGLVEVSVTPRPRPSPVRPRIDPWSFISSGRSRLRQHSPYPDCLIPNCDPFPDLDCDPFARGADPLWTPGPCSPYDPFVPLASPTTSDTVSPS